MYGQIISGVTEMSVCRQDRIKLAEAMGWTDFICEAGLPPGAKGQKPMTQGHQLPPDPFTDANDDYAVLEHFRNKQKAGGGNYKADLANWIEWAYSVDYQIGDYAKAALKVIENATV